MQHCLISKDIRMIRNFKCVCVCACACELKGWTNLCHQTVGICPIVPFPFLLFCFVLEEGIPKSCTNRKTDVVQHRRSFRRIAPPLFFLFSSILRHPNNTNSLHKLRHHALFYFALFCFALYYFEKTFPCLAWLN